MSKSTITRLFVGSLIAIGAGLVLMFGAMALAFAGSSFVMNGPDVVGIQSTPFSWAMVFVAGMAILAVAAGGIGQLVAWIGAVLNTAKLEDKTWFLLLLLLGLLSFGLAAMVVYVIAGPDGLAEETAPRPLPRQQSATT
ncbi:MAG TPA: hypothetical protein VET65_00460 [Candidatus Limnocylindrales bacterium]|nr:hypothetical protein [Candidatus Limnocylindrales bacterium]